MPSAKVLSQYSFVVFMMVTCMSSLVWPMSLAPSSESTDSTLKNNQPSCEQVKSFLSRHVQESSAKGATSLSVCESRDTCCTPAMEAGLRKSAQRDFHHALRVSSGHLRLTLTEAASSIQGQMIEHVKASQVKTQTMFAELYKRVARLARDPIANLFAELEQFISGDDQTGDVDVTAAVNRFFDDLFPRLYGQTTRGVQGPTVSRAAVRDLPHDFVECLRGAQSELRPFGEIPRRLASSLSRSLDASRALIQSIRLGLDVLNATDHTELNEDCSAALLRATHCAQCRGYAAARPCRGLCSNVARGCLAGVADVDQPWNEWVDAMERLTGALVNGDLGTHDILSSIDSRLSEAVLYALENGPILEKKVKRICGERNSTGGAISNSSNGEAAEGRAEESANGNNGEEIKDLSLISDQSVSGDLKSRLQSLLSTLASARGFYANLPDAVCVTKSSPFASQEDTNCWNGQRYGEYTKPISGIGMGAQKYNAEVKVSRADVDLGLVQLSDKLRHVRQVLISKTVAAPEPDSLVMADFGSSGSGDGSNSNGGAGWDGTDAESDRDDGGRGTFTDVDVDGSGSGDGRPPKTDFDNNSSGNNKKTGSDDIELVTGTDGTTPRVTVTDKSSGSGAVISSLLVTLCLSAVTVWRSRFSG